MTDRRDLLILLGAAALAPRVVRAQEKRTPAKIHRIGVLSTFLPSDETRWHHAFRLGLRDLGWVEGKNIGIEYRHAEGKNDRLPALAADLVHRKVDIIFATTLGAALAARNSTSSVPIVVATGGDLVAAGLVERLARPGGNVTGLSQMSQELVGKRLELLTQLVPKLSRVAVLWDSQAASAAQSWKEMQPPARQLGVQLQSLEVRRVEDLAKAFEDATRARAGALFIIQGGVIVTNLERIAGLAKKSRLPSIFYRSEFADAGGLVAYGEDRADMFRRAATYVDKILKGAKPSDLPIDRATKFELVVNMTTAKALGITIPPSVLVRADRVIE